MSASEIGKLAAADALQDLKCGHAETVRVRIESMALPEALVYAEAYVAAYSIGIRAARLAALVN